MVSAEPAPLEKPAADVILEDQDDPTPGFEIADRDPADDIDDSDDAYDADDVANESEHRPRSIDLSEPDEDDDFDTEEVVTRVSARPWERG